METLPLNRRLDNMILNGNQQRFQCYREISEGKIPLLQRWIPHRNGMSGTLLTDCECIW